MMSILELNECQNLFLVTSISSWDPVVRRGHQGEQGTGHLERRLEGLPDAAILSLSANEDFLPFSADVFAVGGFALLRLNCACRRAVTQPLLGSRREVSWRRSTIYQ